MMLRMMPLARRSALARHTATVAAIIYNKKHQKLFPTTANTSGHISHLQPTLPTDMTLWAAL